MKEIQFILIDTGSASNKMMMSDVGKMENGIQITETNKVPNKFIGMLIKLHFSYALTRLGNLPGKAIWSHWCVLNDLTADNSKEYYIVVVNNAIHRLSVSYLNKLDQKENIHLFSLLLDPFDFLPVAVRKMIRATHFEKVYSFQQSDCEKYGFTFTNQIYSRVDMDTIKSDEAESDIYFIGSDKGRVNMIYGIYQRFAAEGIVCDFTVVASNNNVEEYIKLYPGLTITDKRIGYDCILKKIAKTSCILELCQDGQDGLTMRFYEALFYNKMLITNNQTALGHSMFNSEFMQVINGVDDIDIVKIKKNSNTNYHYNNEMSPKLFMQGLVEN